MPGRRRRLSVGRTRNLHLLLVIGLVATASAEMRWLTLPPTPTLPKAARSGHAAVNGINIWYAVFGHGEPVILLHGGLANANYWGNQVPALARRHQVVVMDSRGHGRSSRDERPFGYHLMATDVLALMDFLKIGKAAIVGWSDGAIVGLDLAINQPDRLTRLFAFAANSDPSGVKDPPAGTAFHAFLARTRKEYEALSPTPDQYESFVDQITTMWKTQPSFTAEQLKSIRVPTWIVDADHDEAIERQNTLFMADQIPRAALLIQPAVSHFSLLQAPQQFNEDVLRFLEDEEGR
jgi:pimeloyl-ACP methyl ester carboxylesterase